MDNTPDTLAHRAVDLINRTVDAAYEMGLSPAEVRTVKALLAARLDALARELESEQI